MTFLQILLLSICYLTSTNACGEFYQMAGDEYQQMSYTPMGPTLAQFNIKSKLLCAAQCTHLFPTCNIAVFDYSTNPQCLLYTEKLTPANLISSATAIVVDLRRNNANEETSTEKTTTEMVTTSGPSFIANTYGSLNATGMNDNRNDYLIFNNNQPITLAGFVSNVSIKFCSLPATALPVLWIYVVNYTGSPTYYVSHSMYAVPYNQISTNDTIQHYTIPYFQLSVGTGEYVGIGFGKTTGGSPCRVTSGSSAYTQSYGGANQTYLVGTQGSSSFSTQAHRVAIEYTILTPV